MPITGDVSTGDTWTARGPALTERLVAGAPMLVMVVDQVGTITWIDGAVTELTGHDPSELVGTSILGHLDLEWNPSALDSIEAALGGSGLQRPMLYRVIRKDGTAFVAEVTANSQLDDPVVQGLAVYVRRWDERHLLDQVLESLASDASLDATLQLLTRVMGAETLDADSVVMLRGVGTSFERTVTHLELDDALTTAGDATDTPWHAGRTTRSLRSGGGSTTMAPSGAGGRHECRLPVVLGVAGVRTGSGRRLPRPVASPGRGARPHLPHAARHLGARHRARAATAARRRTTAPRGHPRPAHRSGEPGPVHGATRERAQRRRRGPLVGVLYVDLDDFKPVNDRLGHGAGDQVLCEIAKEIAVRRSARATSWPGSAATSSRSCARESPTCRCSRRWPNASRRKYAGRSRSATRWCNERERRRCARTARRVLDRRLARRGRRRALLGQGVRSRWMRAADLPARTHQPADQRSLRRLGHRQLERLGDLDDPSRCDPLLLIGHERVIVRLELDDGARTHRLGVDERRQVPRIGITRDAVAQLGEVGAARAPGAGRSTAGALVRSRCRSATPTR